MGINSGFKGLRMDKMRPKSFTNRTDRERPKQDGKMISVEEGRGHRT